MIGSLLWVVAMAGQSSAPFLSPTFGDHMVLQRDRPNTFWGWTSPGSDVKVTIEGRTAHGTADASGKWMVRISPPKVGGPYKVSIDGPQHAELDDVLVGDVWICSGQSNMEFGIGNGLNAEQEIAAANYPNIRLAMVPHAVEFTPKAVSDFSWAACTPQSIAQGGWNGFSAAAYFFGRELNKRLNVPIGLVQTVWGGTIAEAWTSKQGLIPLKDFDKGLAAVDGMAHATVPDFGSEIDAWLAKNDAGSTSGSGFVTSDFDDSTWPSTPTIAADYDSLNLSQFDGVVWYRKEVDLPATLPDGPITISIGTVDDQDTTWVNGQQVGRMFHYNDIRKYVLPANLMKPGKNTIVVRCLDTGAQGGFRSPADTMYIEFGDKTKQMLEGSWKYKVGADLKTSTTMPQQVEADNPNVPTVLYNGMIYPLQPLAIKGAIWYQGESNADRADQYRKLLPAMIGDWRREWGEGDFPFFIVQLANFMAADAQPVDSQWAELREAQTLTANTVKNGGLALAIDIGDAADIHPKNKQDVGYRLALAALHVAYHQKLAYSGPTFKSQQIQGSTIRLTFDHVEGGLKVKGDSLKGFAIAGADHKFHWADAKIDGSTVIVSSADVTSPVAVRYDWGNNPDSTLYNSADLPTVPFKTDDWPWITAGHK